MADSKSTKKSSKKAAESVDETVEVTAVDEVIEVVEEEPVVDEAPAETPSEGEAQIVEALEKDPKLVGRLKDLLGIDTPEIDQQNEVDNKTPFFREVTSWAVDVERTAALKAADVAKAFDEKVDNLVTFDVRSNGTDTALHALFTENPRRRAKKIK